MRKRLLPICLLLVSASPSTAHTEAQVAAPATCPATGTPQPADVEQPAPHVAITRHHFSTGGRSFDYTATAGTLLIRDDQDRPSAEIGYTAYTRPAPAGSPARPVLFAFNGGPGSSSAFLHIGMLGPRRALVNDAAPTSPASVRMTDNEFGMLDKADVVMIDPVGTGIAHAVCGKKDADFWTVDADAESVGRFIMRYLDDYGGWTAPKYIMGESYGTVRAAVVLNYLRTHRVSFNGAILLGTAMDMEAVYTDLPGNDRPYPLFVPGFAAAAWYHKLIPAAQGPLEPFLDEARRFALGPYAAALMKGSTLPDAERDTIAEQMHRFTGLSTDYIKASDLRVSEFAYGQEVMRGQGKTVSRLDARFVGTTEDVTQKSADYDPLLGYLGTAFSAAFQDYYRGDLKAGTDRSYELLNSDAGNRFSLIHKPLGAPGDAQPIVNAGVDLAKTMVQDPTLHVLVMAGYFDLGSPVSAAEYMIDHLRIPRETAARITMKYYPSGHLIYINPPSLRKMKVDMDEFLDATR